ncbi:hypothetical protein CRN61_24130, partial [Vibrio vulnificus]
MSKDNELDIFRQQIEQTNKHGEYILRAIDEIKDIKEEMLTINARTNDRLEDLENTKTLLNGEAKKVKSQVMRRAYLLANKYFKNQVSDELFHKKRIHLQ